MGTLVDRTTEVPLSVIKLTAELPAGGMKFVIGDQLLSAGTSPGAHFREALRARSKAEYVAKLNSGLMELEETVYWLDLLKRSDSISSERIDPIMNEAQQLIAIFVSLIKKWKRPRK